MYSQTNYLKRLIKIILDYLDLFISFELLLKI
jgi:hypothetical protein